MSYVDVTDYIRRSRFYLKIEKVAEKDITEKRKKKREVVVGVLFENNILFSTL
jgi:hypothetical protein